MILEFASASFICKILENIILLTYTYSFILGPPLSPTETLVLLIQAGQYDTAFSIAKAFELSLNSIFDGLAARYFFNFLALSMLLIPFFRRC